MTDPINQYSWWWQTKHLSREEIEEMRRNMKKVPVIQLQSDVYHEKEVDAAENILGNINDLPVTTPEQTTQESVQHISLRQQFIHRLQQLFTSPTQ